MTDTSVPGQVAAQDPGARYALGSVLSHVLLHQTIIGEEALLQLAKIDETPDLLVCQGSAGLSCIGMPQLISSSYNVKQAAV